MGSWHVFHDRLRPGLYVYGWVLAARCLHVQRRVRVLIVIKHGLHGQWRYLLSVWGRLQLRGGQRPDGRVQLLRGPRFDFDDIDCLHQYIFHVPRSRVWRG
jgi:hypothetical protein